jgi:hypothetical protein
MKLRFVGVIAAFVPAVAQAQAGWTPGAEIVGQPVRVTTNGVTNIVTLNPGGQAQISSPAGRVVNGSWTAANGQLCLSNGVAQECFPYAAPLRAGQPVTVTSSCNAMSTWLAASTNQASPPAQGQRGERGQ